MNFLEEAELVSALLLSEARDENAYTYHHNKLGETKFTETDGSEFYIQNILQEVADNNNVSISEITDEFYKEVDARKEEMKKSMKINNTMIKNIAESVAFQFMEGFKVKGTEIVPGMVLPDGKEYKGINLEDVEFDKSIFRDMFNAVKAEVPDLYPLSNPFEPKRVEARVYFTPDKLYPEFNSVKTAACTPTAQLLFNTPFMKKLVKFAKIKGIKADPKKLHGKKYVSQGGEIPDEYLYCEFVLIHELKHYQNGDFFFEKKFNLNGTLVNYTGDFITNYELVKNGYAQLPIGLFNDEINYDRYNTYQDMYDVIKTEMEKLSPEDQDKMKQELNDLGDDMPEEGQGADPDDNGQGDNQNQQGQPQDGQGQPQDGQGQPQDGQGQSQDGQGSGDGEQSDSQDGKDGQGSGDGEESDSQDGKDGQGSGSGNGEKTKEEKEAEAKAAAARAKEREEAENRGETSGLAPADPSKPEGKVPSSIDEMIKKNQQAQAEAQSEADRDVKTGMNKDAMQPGAMAQAMAGQNNGTGNLSADGNPYALPERVYTPKLNWKQLIKKMVPSGSLKDETYSKPSRRSTSSMVTMAQTGSGVVKPGMKEVDDDKKGLCFVLDESGSTMDKIGEMKQSILKLIEKHQKDLNGEMYFIKFSNDVHMFKIDLKKKKYGRIINIHEFINTGKTKDVKVTKNMMELFRSTYGGGTELNSKIADIVLKLKTKLNFNTILFTDSDCAYGSNAETLKRIYKQLGQRSFALIGCDQSDYKAFAQLLGDKKNITHF